VRLQRECTYLTWMVNPARFFRKGLGRRDLESRSDSVDGVESRLGESRITPFFYKFLLMRKRTVDFSAFPLSARKRHAGDWIDVGGMFDARACPLVPCRAPTHRHHSRSCRVARMQNISPSPESKDSAFPSSRASFRESERCRVRVLSFLEDTLAPRSAQACSRRSSSRTASWAHSTTRSRGVRTTAQARSIRTIRSFRSFEFFPPKPPRLGVPVENARGALYAVWRRCSTETPRYGPSREPARGLTYRWLTSVALLTLSATRFGFVVARSVFAESSESAVEPEPEAFAPWPKPRSAVEETTARDHARARESKNPRAYGARVYVYMPSVL